MSLRVNNANTISIQDVVVIAHRSAIINKKMDEANPTGEYGNPASFGGKAPAATETDQQLIGRLSDFVTSLVDKAASEHKAANFQNGVLIAGKENQITRLVTNEFLFYTQKPLSLSQFEALQQKIFDMAKQQPENLHLVLGSFAVEVDDKVMNVVAVIECGANPKLNLIVKNNPSYIDPGYKKETSPGVMLMLDNINISNGDSVSKFKINIDGKSHDFSTNTTVQSHTTGGAQFFTCVDICLDHKYSTAKNHLHANIVDAFSTDSALPSHVSHVLVSNTIALQPAHSIGLVTHADPSNSKISTKIGAKELKKELIVKDRKQLVFGTPGTVIVTEPVSCTALNDAAFLLIAQTGNTPVLEWLKNKFAANINAANSFGHTALIIAAIRGNKNTVDYLIANGADSYILDKNKESALMHAAASGHVNVVATLTDHGHDVNMHNLYGKTALMLAVEGGHFDVMKYLMSKNADINQVDFNGINPVLSKGLVMAVQAQDILMVEYMLSHQFDVNCQNQNGDSALIVAVGWNNFQITEMLLANGANPDATGYGNAATALMRATENGRDDIVRLLLAHNANVNLQDADKETAMFYAAHNGDENLLAILANAPGADLTMQNSKGETALYYLLQQGQTEFCVDLAIQMKIANAEMTHDPSLTLIHHVATTNDSISLDKLLKAGVDVNALDDEGNTPLMCAVARGNYAAVEILLANKDAEKEFNRTYITGKTLLTQAADSGDPRIVTLLLEKGVKPDQTVQPSPPLTPPPPQAIPPLDIPPPPSQSPPPQIESQARHLERQRLSQFQNAAKSEKSRVEIDFPAERDKLIADVNSSKYSQIIERCSFDHKNNEIEIAFKDPNEMTRIFVADSKDALKHFSDYIKNELDKMVPEIPVETSTSKNTGNYS